MIHSPRTALIIFTGRSEWPYSMRGRMRLRVRDSQFAGNSLSYIQPWKFDHDRQYGSNTTLVSVTTTQAIYSDSGSDTFYQHGCDLRVCTFYSSTGFIMFRCDLHLVQTDRTWNFAHVVVKLLLHNSQWAKPEHCTFNFFRFSAFSSIVLENKVNENFRKDSKSGFKSKIWKWCLYINWSSNFEIGSWKLKSQFRSWNPMLKGDSQNWSLNATLNLILALEVQKYTI